VLPPIDDAELTAQALAADPHAALPDDAVPFASMAEADEGGLLPSWYMPAATGGPRTHPRRGIALGLTGTFLLINAAGLCCTYGHIVIA
jgi:hypothetical protein